MISIISPFYNVNKYLPEFLESFVGLDKKKYELILIDDRGQEDATEIINNFREKLNIKLIVNEKNIGQGLSRNKALKHVDKTTTHIIYIDTDDLIFDQTFMDDIKKEQITWFDTISFNKNKKWKEHKNRNINSLLFTTTIWGVAIPIDIAKTITFKHKYYEDTIVNRRLIKYHGDRIVMSKKILVLYRHRKSGVNSSKPTLSKYLDYINSIMELQAEGINTYRFNMQEIYQYYWMWKPHLKDLDKRVLPKINIFYRMWFCFTGSIIRFLRLEGLIYGRNRKNAFE